MLVSRPAPTSFSDMSSRSAAEDDPILSQILAQYDFEGWSPHFPELFPDALGNLPRSTDGSRETLGTHQANISNDISRSRTSGSAGEYSTGSTPSSIEHDTESAIGVLRCTYGIKFGPFLDELLRIFFQNIHPYYPVIDEFLFDEAYAVAVRDEVTRRDRAVTLAAMLLCASMYLIKGKLYASGKWTQASLQQTLYNAIQEMYQPSSVGDNLTLTQACMLLSYWDASYAESSHRQSEWMDRAFIHARSGGLDQTTSEVLTDRSRLIWACCVVRDRIISFSSRRELQPHSAKDAWIPVTKEDFGLELALPRYADVSARNHLIDAFLLLCQLSEALAEIMEFQQRLKPRIAAGRYSVDKQEILQVSQYDVRLREWKRGFQIWKSGPRVSNIVDSRGAYFLRNVVAESATAALYLPYIKPPSMADPITAKFSLAALIKVKDAAAKVADTIHQMVATVRIEEIPPFMSIWLPLPLLTLLVTLKFEQLNHSLLYESPCLSRIRYLFSALDIFSTRFPSDRAITEMVNRIAGECRVRPLEMKSYALEPPSDGETEQQLLWRAAYLIDESLPHIL